MSDDTWGFAPPPFNPEASLVQLKRALRDLGLTERSGGFELKGLRALEWTLAPDAISIRLARKLRRSPEWDLRSLRSGADQRKLLDDIKLRLARWADED
jgi:hypothetical protein